MGNASVIAELTSTNQQLEGHMASLNMQLKRAQSKRQQAEESSAEQHAQQAAADAASNGDITNLTQVNAQLMLQLADVNNLLAQAQSDLQTAQDTSSAQHAQQATADGGESGDAKAQLQSQVDSLHEQLEQAQQELSHAEDSRAAQSAHAARSTSDIASLSDVNGQLREQVAGLSKQLELQDTDSGSAQHAQQAGFGGGTHSQLQSEAHVLSQQLEQAQRELTHLQDFRAAQHAQHAAQSTGEIAQLTEVNAQLMAQIAAMSKQLEQAPSKQTVQAQHAQQASANHDSSSSGEVDAQLQQQVFTLTQQLDQAEHELQQLRETSSAQQAQEAGENATMSNDLPGDDGQVQKHAQLAADSNGDINDLPQANSKLLLQVAERKAQTQQAQRDAQAAAGQLHHMRELVKAQHAKREELQQECNAKELQVGILHAIIQEHTVLTAVQFVADDESAYPVLSCSPVGHKVKLELPCQQSLAETHLPSTASDLLQSKLSHTMTSAQHFLTRSSLCSHMCNCNKPDRCWYVQVQELVAHLDHPEGSHMYERAQRDHAKAAHLTQVNKQLEDHVSSLDMQLEQTQQDLQASHAELSQALAAQRAQHDDHNAEQVQNAHAQAERAQAELDQLQEECTSKDLQVPLCSGLLSFSTDEHACPITHACMHEPIETSSCLPQETR